MKICGLIVAFLCGFDVMAQPEINPRLAVLPPVKTDTNSFVVKWDRQIGVLIFSNRITWSNPYKTNQWWVGDVNQSIFTLVRTQGEPRWKVTVAAKAFDLTPEGAPAFWPPYSPSNRVVQFYTRLSASNRVTVLMQTNPVGQRLFVRLHYLPTNAQWAVPMWMAQTGSTLKTWTDTGVWLVAPQNPKLSLSVSNWSY